MNRSLFWPPFWLPLRTAPSSKLPWLLGLLGRNLLAICTRPLYRVFIFGTNWGLHNTNPTAPESTSNAATIPVEKTIPLPTAAACRQPTAQETAADIALVFVEAPIFPACTAVCSQPTAPENTPNIVTVRVEAPIFIIFPPYSTVRCQPTAQKSTSAAITASYSTRTRPRQTAITEEAFIFPPYTAVCCQPTAPEATVKAATFPTELL